MKILKGSVSFHLGWILNFLGLFLICNGLKIQKSAAEDWKGSLDSAQYSAGAVLGMGIIDGNAGLGLVGTFSKKIVRPGFISGINNSVSIEGELGPVFMSPGTAWVYGAHLRWDFVKDDAWTFFAIGGVGGNIQGYTVLTRYEFYPRFGVGALWKANSTFSVRGQVSHDLIAFGLNFPFYRY